MSKCVVCSKNVLKSRPGVECNRCEALVHLAMECSGLTTKQRAALRANESLEWTCQECTESSPRRRSIVIPDEDEVVFDKATRSVDQVDGKRLLHDINTMLEKALKRELGAVMESIDFTSNKMDELVEGMTAVRSSVQELKKKNVELSNRCNNQETRICALEQRVEDLEQEKLSKTVEVFGLPLGESDNATAVVSVIAEKLEVPASDVKDVQCFPASKDRAGKLQVKFAKESVQSQWLKKAKATRVTVADILPSAPENKRGDQVYISEALTQYKKVLLRDARKQLKESGLYKYVWCKRGVIRARKGDKEPSSVIRDASDVKRLLPK